jgi:hypothetical protein
MASARDEWLQHGRLVELSPGRKDQRRDLETPCRILRNEVRY